MEELFPVCITAVNLLQQFRLVERKIVPPWNCSLQDNQYFSLNSPLIIRLIKRCLLNNWISSLISSRLPADWPQVVCHLWHVLHVCKRQHPAGWASDPPASLHGVLQSLDRHLPLPQLPVFRRALPREQTAPGPPESSPQFHGLPLLLEGVQHDGDAASLAAVGALHTVGGGEEGRGERGEGAGRSAPLHCWPGHDGGFLQTESKQWANSNTHPHSGALQVRQPGQGAFARCWVHFWEERQQNQEASPAPTESGWSCSSQQAHRGEEGSAVQEGGHVGGLREARLERVDRLSQTL